MIKISQEKIQKAENYIKRNCRPLEQARFAYLFKNGTADNVIEELKKNQNTDGGFGNGLEPDFLLPDSSPLATTLAFQFLNEMTESDDEMVKKAIKYFGNNFVKSRNGWFAASKEINKYPHAPWWNWDNEKKQTSIDESWGNPSAEIIGYLWKYQKYLSQLDIHKLVAYAINYWNTKTYFDSEHEVYCFIRLYKHLPPEQREKLEKTLIKATKKLVIFDSISWDNYVPQPIHFADSPNFFLFEAVKEGIETNLDYLVTSINENGVWSPNWSWGQYEAEWEKSKIEWQGILTVRNLRILHDYDRIEK
jgi:hypothetical protein